MTYDLVIIGGGIQGVGTAQAAVAAGHSVLLLEKEGIGAGTSRKSSKLIHGGLRYLESAQLSLVKESLHERALLLQLAPELVKRVEMHIPVYQASSRSPAKIAVGLWLYRLLAGFGEDSEFVRLHRSGWSALDGLKTDDLLAVYRYVEAQTDDRALTQAVWQSAEALGAELAMPAQFRGADCHASGCEVQYEHNGREMSVSARVLVNCAGPWGADLLKHIQPTVTVPEVELVQGSHLLLPNRLQHHFYLEAPDDRRAVFALPWQGRLLLGTTETAFRGAPETAECLPEERDYLLRTFQHYFPGYSVEPNDVSSFAGLRVLPRANGSAFGRSREVLFQADQEDQPRVLSVLGGKLTTYRATALEVMERLGPSLPRRRRVADTARIHLTPP
ncbi:glycerol-3-phosphate dehydrogenase/oxidase [Marinimicrobium agarilyticum]|uniref:glycerol-3-phosphate dehydrogenase/oxidase n=1 Tax=Marinimicrobium agarilyticum TaxID=306546 RepID=UPI00042957A0|nr:FAD-dependent oxidoreductase [Marinimicrobium agarilyticum]